MKKCLLLICVICVVLSCSSRLHADEEKVVAFASLDWPPYIGADLPEQGANAVVARAAFAAMGYNLRIDFYPWARTIALARREGRYAGYFPEYYAKELEVEFIFSDPIGESPLGFVERKDTPVQWNSLDDLKGMTIGTVLGYVNTKEFDQKVKDGEIFVDPVSNDMLNIRKVAMKRMPLAVIDQYVLKYLSNTEKELAEYLPLVQFNSKLLEQKQLYLCFRKGVEGERLVSIFNEGLKKIDAAALTQAYFEKFFYKE